MAMAATELAPSIEKLVMNAEPALTVASAVGTHKAVLEPKMDGWRVIAIVGDDGKVRTYTRKGNELTRKMPAIEAELTTRVVEDGVESDGALPPGTILDGEVVSLTIENGKIIHKRGEVASILQSGEASARLRSGILTYVVFDMLAHRGLDARKLPYEGRRTLLENLFEKAEFSPRITLVPQLPATDDVYDALLEQGYEGGVVKWLDAPYKSGIRGSGWLKIKGTKTVDVIVTGFKPGQNSWQGLVGALHFGQYDENGILVERGRTSGMDYDTRLEISADPDAYLGKVFELTYNMLTEPSADKPHGAFLHPRFVRWREDKSPESVVIHDA